jgi:hypothetical protein
MKFTPGVWSYQLSDHKEIYYVIDHPEEDKVFLHLAIQRKNKPEPMKTTFSYPLKRMNISENEKSWKKEDVSLIPEQKRIDAIVWAFERL